MTKTTAHHILIIGPSWVGDMVMAQALFQTLKQNNPSVVIDVLAPAWSLPILERMPQVRRAFVMTVGHGRLKLKERFLISRSLRSERYDQAILLPNAFKSALIPIFARIPRRTGWRGEMRFGLLNDIRRLDRNRYPLMVERFVALANAPGDPLPNPIPFPALRIKESDRQRALEKFALDTDKPALVLCPGAEFGPAKQWPQQYYAQVAQHCIERGMQVWLFGSAKDQPVAQAIMQAINSEQREYCQDLSGKTSLAEVVDLMSLADVVVSNDSGLMHVAAALDRSLVVVYGSTSPEFTPPLARSVQVLFEEVECGPCFERVCPQQHLKCLVDLSPQRVLRAIENLQSAESAAIPGVSD